MARKKFSCDFETTTKLDDCRVWAYGHMEIGNPENYKFGTDLDEFMRWVENINADLYFHNLSFDGEFIINWLLKNNFKYDESGKEGTFKVTISGMGQWYMIDICYGYDKRNKKIHTTIYDSLKKLPFTVKQIAIGFQLHIQKGGIDYHAPRPVGHILTPEEELYLKNDIEIIACALDAQFKQGLTKMTNGSDSLTGFKDSITKKVYDKMFPVLDKELDAELRAGYRGGFTWLNEKYYSSRVKKGIVFDVNSLYPSQMYYRNLPFGLPIEFEGKYEYDESHPLFVQVMELEFSIKDERIPTIQIKRNFLFKGNEYLKSSGGERVKMTVTNVDLELMEEHYELYEPVYIKGWKFKSQRGIFTNFIDKWMYIKTTEKGAKKQLAKLMLNSLYGKFASNPKVTGKLPYLKDDGSCGYKFPTDEDGNVIDEFKDTVYTPMGMFITAYAREVTITTAQKCFDRIIYCDTDSIHLVGTEIPDAIKDVVDPDKLGQWKHEGTFKRAKFIRQKTYLEEYEQDEKDYGFLMFRKKFNNKNVKLKCPRPDIKCAGMPESIKNYVSYNNFEVGFSSWGKLSPRHVDGGIVLVDGPFTIN